MHTSARKACARGRIRGCASAAAAEAADVAGAEAAGNVATAEGTTRSSTVAGDCQYWLSKSHQSGACQG